MAARARDIYDKFEAIGWDATSTTTTSSAARPVPVELSGPVPPSDHPIWGDNGIMRGVVMAHGPGGNITYQPDPRRPARDARFFGHNGLAVGRWFPNRASAVAHGAHAQRVRGIAGHGEYDRGADRDEGDVLYYSAKGGTGKDARQKSGSKLNQAMHASRRTGRPVRVLRSAKQVRAGAWAPPCGLRYGGLYRVTAVKGAVRNDKGGLFEQFKLERLPGQPSLEEVCRASPTAREVRDYERIKLGGVLMLG